ncbi:hypothetical protein [Flavobacterium crocinum]|uniref:hypothetical protein n=1 Tax=Flavobacterium crocinum TaxID=2183896 RepID=UPI001F0BDBAE|nr:hypothetical protein [Flavobacterium crocinum]
MFFIFSTSFTPPETTVYVCGSSGAKKENCRGLRSCRSETVKTTLKQAKGLGLSLCGWED